ncbi:hypothetical protein [Streptomyces fragilis]|uniref:Septum formation-related domain-containing protein n=1 Tax=Streptomyces fragilis TaxID=67301 RepID=A0ABV2YPL6_9ACTN|nr:hypothetical protein [Streptomyces fragilis]
MADARGRKTWRVVLIALAAALGCAALAAAWYAGAAADAPDDRDARDARDARDQRGATAQEAPCAEALAFAGGTLPSGATDARCTVQTWLDTHYRADFRMPRAEVADWTARNWPAIETRTEFCHPESAALCASTDSTGGRAHALNVTVTYEDAGTARVRLEAFTT